MTEDASKSSRKRHRSPNHPYLSLPQALELVESLEKSDGLDEIPVAIAHERWNYKRHSSIANRCVAALESYGLVDVDGVGEKRKVKVSERARRIIKQAPDRLELLRKAALEPAIHSELWDKYKDQGRLPNDDVLVEYLRWDRPEGTFNEDVVGTFVENLKASIRLAELEEAGNIDQNNGGHGKDETPSVSVGGLVQWTSQGKYQFPEPRRVTGIQGEWAFVEGSQTGLPVSELTVVDVPKPPASQGQPPLNPHFKPPEPHIGMAKERTTLDEGAVELTMPEKLGPGSVQDFHRWVDDQKDRAHRRAGGQNKSIPLPKGGMLHLISFPGSDKWHIKSYDFSWVAGMHLMTARVHAAANGWESIEFDKPEEAVEFVSSLPLPSVVPPDKVIPRD